MKYLLIIFVLFSSFGYSSIDERKIDIYFGNGVGNDYPTAYESKDKLETFIKKTLNYNQKKLKHLTFYVAYNWSDGYAQDVLETFYQLQNRGQLGFLYEQDRFWDNIDIDEVIKTKLRNKYISYTSQTESNNVDEMLQNYRNQSFALSHRVLLISHSQGNLFANRIYDEMYPSGYRRYFKNIGVASPVNKVPGNGHYVTNDKDPIIVPIPGHMPANNSGFGHSFVSAYLFNDTASDKILRYIKSALKTLKSKPSQWYTDSEYYKGTCQYTIKLKHDFDNNKESILHVRPFNTSGIVYALDNNANKRNEYLKGSYDGEYIASNVDKLDLNASPCSQYPLEIDCYELIGTGEKIIRDINLTSRYKILEEYSKGTCDYHSLVIDLHADRAYDVIPFDTGGAYLYSVPSYDGSTKTVLSGSCQGTNIVLTPKAHECFELNNTAETINQSITVQITKLQNECKVENITGQKYYNYWEDFCDYSVVINDWIYRTWDWANDSLAPCEFPHQESESSDVDIPEGMNIKSEVINSDSTKLVYDSTDKNAINVKYIRGQARCWTGSLATDSWGTRASSIKYKADVHKGYEHTINITRVYGE